MAIDSRNPVLRLQDFGQSVWLDYLRRSLITEGGLQRLITEDGLRGVTSNPSIFEKAIGGSTDYTDALKRLAGQQDRDAMEIYEELAIEDIRGAADILRPVYDATGRHDGYVSLEVSPYLAHDTAGTIDEARRLWTTVERENLMVKVPATPAGVPAIKQLTEEGINVNVTLLFGLEMYDQVVDAYLAGLEARLAAGRPLDHIASVASFFVSRVDTAADALIAERLANNPSGPDRARLQGLLGKVAVANAKLAYQRYKERFRGQRWDRLEQGGAKPQRLLWASTSTKNPAYRDIMYVAELIGPDTVTTVPPTTLDAFRDHGDPRPTLELDVVEAQDVMDTLRSVGIDLRAITDTLMEDGVRLFAESFDQLLGAVEERRREILGRCIDRLTAKLPNPLDSEVMRTVESWRAQGNVRRLWQRDASLWTGADESRWLGWLGLVEEQKERDSVFQRLAEDVRREGISDAVVLGMGGSSLCPDVLAATFGKTDDYPQLIILDSTDPDQIRRVERAIDLATTLFIVSSKSGTTLEPNILADYFLDRVRTVLGPDRAGQRFLAITDPGSALQTFAERQGFRATYFGQATVGGRYSALSDFGMVPAALSGIDVPRFIENADVMVNSCAASVPPKENPGAVLGVILGTAALQGRDKVTLVSSPAIASLGAWIEQLLAESTGKRGTGLIPIDREPLGAPDVYGADRVFVYTRLDSAPDATQDRAIAAIEEAGHPVVRLAVADTYQLGQEFFRWEMATAVAGSILGINPFDQPDVEASKEATRRLSSAWEESGSLPADSPIAEEDGLRLCAGPNHAQTLSAMVGPGARLIDILRAHVDTLRSGDYFGILAFLDHSEALESRLQRLRRLVRDRKRVATVLGFGPRYLHSTGQAYKGGPNSGVFLQITADRAEDISVPGHRYTFGVVQTAQALGDFQVLSERGRRAIRVHLGGDVSRGIDRLELALDEVLS